VESLSNSDRESHIEETGATMDEKIQELIGSMERNPPTTSDSITEIEEALRISFPIQYKNFMLESNGAEGCIGESSYLAIWRDSEIVRANRDLKIEEYTPGLVLFASDRGGTAYAFDKRQAQMPIVEIPDDSIHIEEAVKIADTFTGFLQYLYDFED
jgi:hypothetical protein